jgi:hypothetical protein
VFFGFNLECKNFFPFKFGDSFKRLLTSLFAADCALFFNSREDLVTGPNQIFASLRNFCIQMHIGRGATASKTEAMCFSLHGSGFVEFSEGFKYLGSVIDYYLTSDVGVCKRIKSATEALGASKNLFGDKYLSEKIKGQVYTVLVLSTFCSMAAKFGSFEKICFSDFGAPTIRHSITFEISFRRLGILDLGSYCHNRVLRWAGHAARMSMSRALPQPLTG